MTSQTYIRLLWCLFLANGLLNVFVGWRPPFPFIPFGIASLIVVVIGVLLAVRAHRRGDYPKKEFQLFSVCCFLYGAYILAETIVLVSTGEIGHACKALASLLVIMLIWFGEHKRLSFFK